MLLLEILHQFDFANAKHTTYLDFINIKYKMIFESKHPEIKIPQTGIYQYMTSNPQQIPDDKIRKLGFQHGDVLAIFSPNQYDYPIVLFGTIAAGGKVTTANPKYKAAEFLHQLSDSGASVLTAHPGFLDAAIEASINAGIPPPMYCYS
ncbi:14451_t:CDS:2, partial [Racocetra persica]